MKKYRLLKDHPYAKAGTIITEGHRNTLDICLQGENGYKQLFFTVPLYAEKEWLEPVETRWEPKLGDRFFYVGESIEVKEAQLIVGLELEDPNVFRTREQAEEAAKRVKACLEAYHVEIGE